MRLYNRADFLKLPGGTIYCSGKPWAFGELSVKADTLPYNDFVCLGLQWIEASDSGEASDRLDKMLAEGASFPLQESYGRDGSFDDEEIYLVYERNDLETMIQLFRRAAELDPTSQPNDDSPAKLVPESRYRGKPLSEMSRAELVDGLETMGRLYTELLEGRVSGRRQG